MFAVIAQTEMEPASLDGQQLEHMVSVVRGSAGFIRGYWARDASQASTVHAVVLFDSQENADTFAAGVSSNIAGATVRVAEVLAEA